METAAEKRQPLLEKVYYDDCPGCKVEKRKIENPGIPYKEFLYVWLVTLCTSLPISSLFPFIYFMIRDMHIAKREEDVSFYAGFVGASFMLGRALTSVMWGMVADRYGRKPVIVLGIIAVIVFNTIFGLSTNFWMAITTRLLLGALNGVLGPVKAYASEVCPAQHEALGLSLVNSAWAIGLIIGPAIGGYFAQPTEKFPSVFSEKSLFGRFPYFLPCLCISLFGVIVLVTVYWLPETLHKHKKAKLNDGTVEALEAKEENNGKDGEDFCSDCEGSLWTNWTLMSSIAVYCIFSFHDMAYTEVFPLWAESNKKYGGLNFSSQDVGTVLAISGCGVLIFQVFIYPPINKALGTVVTCRVAAVLAIPLLSTYPFMARLSGLSLQLIVYCASVVKNVLATSIITGTFILQNNATSQRQRGAANGISMTLMSFCKAVAPAAAGAILSWAQKRQDTAFLPGDQMLFFLLNVVEFMGFLSTFKPFLRLPQK